MISRLAQQSLSLSQWCSGMSFELPMHLLELPVTGIALDSRQVTSGDCFLVYPLHDGNRHLHGGNFISAALANGASLVLVDAEIAVNELHIPAERAGSVLRIHGLRAHVGELCARFFGQPSRQLPVVAITGTNGKSSCAHFLAQAPVLAKRGNGAMIGTLGWGLLQSLQDSSHTTPDALQLQYRLAQLALQKPALVAIEASSHALAQRRVSGCHLAVAALTNLSQDHLDYHLNMQAYAQAKLKLFTEHEVDHMLLGVDDHYSRMLQQQLLAAGHAGQLLTTSARSDAQADIRVHAASSQCADQTQPRGVPGMRISVQSPWGSGEVQTHLLGHFNLHNLATVIGCLGLLGWSWKAIIKVLQGLQPVPGRMQLLPAGPEQPLLVVDYAHTPDALQTLLESARYFCRGSLYCVFGCGGDRDRSKRAQMGAIAGQLADQVIITSDNPRHEAPEQIIAEIRSGMPADSHWQCLPDRRQAIATALQQASADDVIIIAGKGHERYQLIGNQRLAFDDAAIVMQLAAALSSQNQPDRSRVQA